MLEYPEKSKGDLYKIASQANAIFEKTKDTGFDFVIIGPNRIRENPELIHNFGAISLENQNAAILSLEESKWSILANDAFTFGAIAGLKDVYTTVADIPDSNVLWNTDGTLTPFGRECAILFINEYRLIQPRDKGLLTVK